MAAAGSYDVAVIGGGIVGLATALALCERYPRARVALLEKEATLGFHQTRRNSTVMHSGVYYRPGSYKARFAVEGRRLLMDFCEKHGILWKRCVKVVVAPFPADVPQLIALLGQGVANGVGGLELIGPERLREIEPHVRGVRALYIPDVGTVDFPTVAKQIASLLPARDVDVKTRARVMAIAHRDGGIVLETGQGEVRARYLVNCAGLHADLLARMAGVRLNLQLIPFRIMRFLLRPGRDGLVRSIVYQIPPPGFPAFGVHVTRQFDDAVEVGPGVMLALAREGYTPLTIHLREALGMLRYPGFWRLLVMKWRIGMAEAWRAGSKVALVRALRPIIPELRGRDLVRFKGMDGILAPAFTTDGEMVDDFRIVEEPRGVHLVNAPSPAASGSLALGRHLADVAARACVLG